MSRRKSEVRIESDGEGSYRVSTEGTREYRHQDSSRSGSKSSLSVGESNYRIELNMDEINRLTQRQKNSILRTLVEGAIEPEPESKRGERRRERAVADDRNHDSGNNSENNVYEGDNSSPENWRLLVVLFLGAILGLLIAASIPGCSGLSGF